MFKVGDYVKVIKGLHNGSEGTVVKISKNDMGTITYEIHVEKLFKRIGNISKREGELKMAKRGRPAKSTNKIEQLKEVTKQVVEMAEAEPTAAVDNPVETVDELFDEAVANPVKTDEEVDELFDEAVELLGNPVGTVEKAVDKVEKPIKVMTPYEYLIDFYREVGKKLSVPELEAFCDNVTADLKASKEVLEKMYQMPVGILAKIREEY